MNRPGRSHGPVAAGVAALHAGGPSTQRTGRDGAAPARDGPGSTAELAGQSANPLEPLAQLLRDLRASRDGLSSREAARRLQVSGPNELARRGGRR